MEAAAWVLALAAPAVFAALLPVDAPSPALPPPALNFTLWGLRVRCVTLHGLPLLQEERRLLQGLHTLGFLVTWQRGTACPAHLLFTDTLQETLAIIHTFPRSFGVRVIASIANFTRPPALEGLGSHFGEASALILTPETSYWKPSLGTEFAEQRDLSEVANEGGPITDFNGKTITVSAFNVSVFTKIGQVDNNGVPGWSKGVELEILKEIIAHLNLTWRVNVPTEQHKWGYKFPNGSWSGGIYKRIVEGEADVGLGCIWMTIEKFESFSLSTPIAQLCTRHLVWRPYPLEDWKSLFRPLSPLLWLCLVLAVIFFSFFLWAFSRATFKLLHMESLRQYCFLGWSCLVTVSSLMATNIPGSQESQGPVRHLFNGWLIFALLMTTSFGSSLVSYLTTPLLSTKVDTVKDLASANFKWGMNYKPDMNLILDMSNPWHVKWSEDFRLILTPEEHLAWLKEDDFVLWGKSIGNYFFLNEDFIPESVIERFEASSECVTGFYFIFGVRRGSPYLEPIDLLLLRMRQAGIIDHILQGGFLEAASFHPYIKNVFSLTKASLGQLKPLTLDNLAGIFLLLIAGISSSLVAFLAEITYSRCF